MQPDARCLAGQVAGPESLARFAVTGARRFTHLRLTIYLDGGMARQRAEGRIGLRRKVSRAAGFSRL